MTQRYYSMRDAYQSIYEKQDEKNWPHIKNKKDEKKIDVKYDKGMGVHAPTLGIKPEIKEAIDTLLDAGVIDEESAEMMIEAEVKKNPYPSPYRPHGPKTKKEDEERKAADKKLFDRKYFDSPRD
jgi:hypothetical protein